MQALFRRLFTALVSLATSLGFIAALSAQAGDPNPGTFLVRLLDPDGKPIAGADAVVHDILVRPLGSDPSADPQRRKNVASTSDSDGRVSFAFDPATTESFIVDIHAKGYAGARWVWNAEKWDLRKRVFDVGEERVPRAGSIRGRIVDPAGNPVAIAWKVEPNAMYRPRGAGGEELQEYFESNPATAEFKIPAVVAPPSVYLRAYSPLTGWIDGPNVPIKAGEESVAEIVYRGPDVHRRIVVTHYVRDTPWVQPKEQFIELLGAPGPRRVPRRFGSQSWAFDDVPSGTYTIRIQDPAFLEWRESVKPGDAVEAHLQGPCSIQLRVVDGATSRPIADYRLRQLFRRIDSMSPPTTIRERNQAEPAGGLYLGFFPGNHVFLVDSPGYAQGEVRVDDLKWLGSRELTVAMTRGARVAGTVRQADGTPAGADLEVTLSPRFSSEERTRLFQDREDREAAYVSARTLKSKTDAAGRFEFDLLTAGAFMLKVSISPLMQAEKDIERARNERGPDVDLMLPSRSRFDGRLVGPKRGRFEGISICAVLIPPKGSGAPPTIPRGNRALDPSDACASCDVDAEGKFHFSNLTAGRYQLWADIPAALGADVHRLPQFHQRARRLGLITIPETSKGETEFDLANEFPGRAKVEVRVDGKPAAGYGVWLRQEELIEQSGLGAHTDEHGVAQIGPAFPGYWTVTVEPPQAYWWYVRPEPIEVPTGGEESITIDLTLVEGVLEVVDDTTGKPLPRYSIWLGSPTRLGNNVGKTDEQGRIRLRLPPQDYSIRFPYKGGRVTYVPVKWTAKGPDPAIVRAPTPGAGEVK